MEISGISGNTINMLVSWLLFSVGLWRLLIKMKWEHPWMAWIPGLRIYALASAIDLDRDGVVCGVVEILIYINSLIEPAVTDDRTAVFYSLAVLVLVVMQIVYEIRIFLRLTFVMGVRKRWIFLWLIASWLPMLIFGFSNRFQPRTGFSFNEDWEAGTCPADLSAAQAGGEASSGLVVHLRKRTARDFLKTRYLLKDISFHIPNGSLVLLLGGSGSGKTTLVNAIIGYEQADATVLLNGVDVYRHYDRMKYRIGFVPQQNLVRGNDTVEHTVQDAARLRLPTSIRYRQRHDQVKEVMDLLGLTAGQEGLVSKKSGGQLRRISIAMELVVDPELFILDEPDSGLDGVIAREIFTRLREVADTGKIVIVITHTPDRVIDLFDKVIVLGRDSGRVGRLAFYGSPQEAREFFGKDSMEGIVMSVNRKEEGGDGLADEFIARYARMTAEGPQHPAGEQPAEAQLPTEEPAGELPAEAHPAGEQPAEEKPDPDAASSAPEKEGEPA